MMKLNKIAVAVTMAAGLSVLPVSAAKLGENLMGDRFIIHAKSGQMEALKQALVDAGVTINVEMNSISAISATINPSAYQALRGNKNIAEIEIDAKRYFATQGNPEVKSIAPESHLDDYGNWGDTDFIPWGIEAVQGMEVSPDANNPRTVCIVDTGYDLGHWDLQAEKVSGDSEGAGDWFEDGHGHGTHVAGTIAAKGGNSGVVGMIDDSSANLHIVRVFDSGGGFVYASDLVGAVNDCAAAGAHVVNMSLGGILHTKAEARGFEKLRKSGVLMIAAAGNDGNATHNYPASYDAVMSVGAVARSLDVASFTQYTSQVEIAGPGVNVISTYPGGYHAVMAGTSMATPHVVGTAALVWSHFPQCSNWDIRNALRQTAMDVGAAGKDYYSGYGMVQAKDAIDYLSANGCSGQTCKGNECKVD
ncbi:S8 family peptidase [Aliikangiella sp. G2MR2-5]|uniref:S8 family peptidase n=1 Tax=Aliikangiella sp. G2MR2-5 TaxID=2788943 RepID=UPI0018A92B4C|nr:S8 family peptidase [Aliikangiella sp. G2MR2-5]